MLEVIVELREFGDAIKQDDLRQSEMERAMALTMNTTQSVLIAAVKDLKEVEDEHAKQYTSIIANQNIIIANQKRIIALHAILIKGAIITPETSINLDKPTPLLDDR